MYTFIWILGHRFFRLLIFRHVETSKACNISCVLRCPRGTVDTGDLPLDYCPNYVGKYT